MTLANMIEAYTVWYLRCSELSSEIAELTTEDYSKSEHVPLKNRLCYYTDLLCLQADELTKLGIDVDLHETFKDRADKWRKEIASEVA